MEKIVTSANTSQKQIPAVKSQLMEVLEKVTNVVGNDCKLRLLDYGCGKYDLFGKYCEELGLEYYGYDKYNMDILTNFQALDSKPNIVTCNNVLNVIQSDEIMENIVKDLASYGVITIVKVYQGDCTGKGKITKNDCYQRNWKATQYMEVLGKHFTNITKKGDTFICY